MSLEITHHARRRAKGRFKTDDVERLAHSARRDGVTWEGAHGRLRTYLLKIDVRGEMQQRGARAVAHENRVFIFGRDDVLITCYPVPHHHREPTQ